jgi:hypothetical protein
MNKYNTLIFRKINSLNVRQKEQYAKAFYCNELSETFRK